MKKTLYQLPQLQSRQQRYTAHSQVNSSATPVAMFILKASFDKGRILS